jgi:parallel beta-helix repeat protein
MKGFVLRFIPLLILCSVLVSLPEINTVKASGTIYIRADGSIEGTDKIQRDGNVYTLTGNISDSIVVERDNIVVDGAGYTMQGYYRGIDLSHRSNVTIKNTQMISFHRGIYLDGSLNNNIIGNNIIDSLTGIDVHRSSNDNNISGNNIEASIREGINLFMASNNSIIGNNITNNKVGIFFGGSPNNIIYRNSFINNTKQVSDFYYEVFFGSPSVNIWDDGEEGNYWSNYNGTDNDKDGIGDTPYIIYANNTDNYPLMNPVVNPEFPEDEKPTTPTNEPFPTTWVVAATAIVAVIGAALLVYFRKIRKATGKTEKIKPEGVM